MKTCILAGLALTACVESAPASIEWRGGSQELWARGSGSNLSGIPSTEDEIKWTTNSFYNLQSRSYSVDAIGALSRGRATTAIESDWNNAITARGTTTGRGTKFGLSAFGSADGHSTYAIAVDILEAQWFQLTGFVRTYDIFKATNGSAWVNLAARVQIKTLGGFAHESFAVDGHNERIDFNKPVFLPAGSYQIYGISSVDVATSGSESYGSAQFSLNFVPIPSPASLALAGSVGVFCMQRRRR